MSSWNGQLCGEEGYFLQFETKNYETYKQVEKLCQDIMDEETGRKPRKFHDFCSVCGKEELKEDLYIRDGKWICPDCDKKLYPEDYADKLSPEEFVETYCHNCNQPNCYGLGTLEFYNCHYRHELKGYKENEIYLKEDKIIDTTFIPESCRGCSNHPSNGGSGICNCTLGQFKIT